MKKTPPELNPNRYRYSAVSRLIVNRVIDVHARTKHSKGHVLRSIIQSGLKLVQLYQSVMPLLNIECLRIHRPLFSSPR